MAIQFALGHNQMSALRPFEVEPAFLGIEFTRRVATPTHTYKDGLFAVLEFRALTPEQMSRLLAALTLTLTTDSVAITIALPGDDRVTNSNYNGYAVYPTASWRNPLHEDVRIVVRRLVAI